MRRLYLILLTSEEDPLLCESVADLKVSMSGRYVLSRRLLCKELRTQVLSKNRGVKFNSKLRM